MMVTKSNRIFNSPIPVTQPADTHTHFLSLWKCLLLWWGLIIHRDQPFSSMLLDKYKVYVDKRLFQLPSKALQGSKDISSDIVRSTDTSNYEGEKGGTVVKRNHNLHGFWRLSVTTPIWEWFLLSGVISPFMLSSVVNVGVGWKSLWGTGRKEEIEIHWAETCRQMRMGKALRLNSTLLTSFPICNI